MENDEGVIFSWPGGRFEGESLAFCSQRVFTEGFDPRPSLFSLFCQPGMCAHRNTVQLFRQAITAQLKLNLDYSFLYEVVLLSGC